MMRNPLPQLVGKMFARVEQTLTRVWIPELGAKQTTDLNVLVINNASGLSLSSTL